MKQDWDLTRRIVLAIENDPNGVEIELSAAGYSPSAQIGYHKYLLIEMRLADGEDAMNWQSSDREGFITGLTPSGHEFAELARDEKRWADAIAEARNSGTMTLGAISRLLANPRRGQLVHQQSEEPVTPASRISDRGLKMAIVSPASPRVHAPTFGEVVRRLMPEESHKTRKLQRIGKTNPAVQRIKKKVRAFRAEGLSYESICGRLGTSERPPRAIWKDFPWPVAYKKHTSAVTKWLSEACSDPHT